MKGKIIFGLYCAGLLAMVAGCIQAEDGKVLKVTQFTCTNAPEIYYPKSYARGTGYIELKMPDGSEITISGNYRVEEVPKP